jgi:hypothetical protein
MARLTTTRTRLLAAILIHLTINRAPRGCARSEARRFHGPATNVRTAKRRRTDQTARSIHGHSAFLTAVPCRRVCKIALRRATSCHAVRAILRTRSACHMRIGCAQVRRT